jgi:serine/threonine protein kinase
MMPCSGYLPPEYIPGKDDVSEKFDIFSLGVVMLDIISGPEGYKKKDKMSSFQEFIDYVR